jgi:hypothetical protein
VVFTHFGKVGETTQELSLKSYSDFKEYPCGRGKKAGIAVFKEWFAKKSSGCPFDDRHNFEQQPGGYNYVELSGINTEQAKKKSVISESPCSLHPRVASFVQLVFDEDKIP